MHASQMLFVTNDCLDRPMDFVAELLKDHSRGPRGRLQFENAHARFGHHAIDLLLQRAEPAFAPELFLVDAGRPRQKRFPGRDRKDRRRETELLHGRVLEMAMDDLDLGFFPEVRLLQDEDNVLKPFLLDKIQQLPGGLGPWIYHRENEEHDVGARDEALGDGLVFGHHRVGARRIDDVEVAQKAIGRYAPSIAAKSRPICPPRRGGKFNAVRAATHPLWQTPGRKAR